MPLTVWPGRPVPLGATWDGHGTNFALYSAHATRVELCLFDETYGKETARIGMPEQTRNVWHGYVQGVGPGQMYGYRVHGRYAPREGVRFNPNKLLLDPYARCISGAVDWNVPIFGYRIGSRTEDLTRDVHNSARGMPKSVVINNEFDWGDDRPPEVPWSETIVYETHVKGISQLHPDVPEHLRGSYLGLASPPIVEHLTSLGVTAVELLPIHHFIDDKFLLDRGLENYWGYNSIGYFAPVARYASGDRGEQVTEFKQMVRGSHAAGLEVFLDVVYNHTAEGNHLGPTLCFRGVGNPTYYNLVSDNPRYYRDFTGTGNSLNVAHGQTLKLIADSLRYWVQECHVDGFRFDLTITLAREPEAYDPGAAFFDILHQDPVLSRVKLIAEPWDVGDFGYQVGNCPVLWSEWNGKYRDNLRKFWKGDPGQIAELAYRVSGSSDLYRLSGRGPTGSINFVAAHDGFTLRDLVTYNEKHNDANGEHNQDGANDNNSWNSGVEGPTEDPGIENLRARRQRSLLASLFLSQGVPMHLGGDEMGRSQGGNNNAYCQDNEISWFDWTLNDQQRELLEFTRGLIAFRKAHPVLRRRRFFEGLFVPGADIKDLTWFKPDGGEIVDEQWADPEARSLGMRLAGEAIDEREPEGGRISDDTLLVLLNAFHEDVVFTLPASGGSAGCRWELLMDTEQAGPPRESGVICSVGGTYSLAGPRPGTVPPSRRVIVVGLISGTSVDGIDAAVVRIDSVGEALELQLLSYTETDIDEALRQRIHALFDPEQSRIDEACEINVLLGEAFATAANRALREAGHEADLIASHGQTVWHQVAPGHARSTLQLAEPSVIAERLGVTTVADFRPRDIAAGGQGAPLASWPDALLFGDEHLSRAVQNIGGIGNVTWLPPGGQWEAMLAFDTGPGNALIDHAAWRLSGGMQRCDVDGRLAASGRADDRLLSDLLAHPYFAEQPPKSTGRELFGAQFVDPFIERAQTQGLTAPDILATLTAFTAHSIVDQYRRFLPGRPDEVIVGGGGSRNPVLMKLLGELLDPVQVRLHEEFGLPSLGREAIYFALMGYEALHGRANTVPSCTGAAHPVVMGKLVPGANYVALLQQVVASPQQRPKRLVVIT